ncbi:MAG: hypothetical protein HQL07_09910 [Nitrospirae bacterium]|nr:hypothetical protein [Magnetococcales bacterium]
MTQHIPHPKPPRLLPITDADLPAVCQFYHQHLNPRIPVENWINAFSYDGHNGRNHPPNYGFMLTDGQTVVGAFGAIYSNQWIDGRWEPFCNHTSWVVRKAYRPWSRNLLEALLQQDHWHATSFTTNPHVANICRKHQFSQLNDRVEVFFNTPHPFSTPPITQNPSAFKTLLNPYVYQNYITHGHLPGIECVILGQPQQCALVVYKKKIWKKLPAAILLHCSDWEVFSHYRRPLGHFLLSHHGILTTHVHTFQLPTPLTGTLSYRDTQPRLFLSRGTIKPHQLSFLYSEITALNLAL